MFCFDYDDDDGDGLNSLRMYVCTRNFSNTPSFPECECCKGQQQQISKSRRLVVSGHASNRLHRNKINHMILISSLSSLILSLLLVIIIIIIFFRLGGRTITEDCEERNKETKKRDTTYLLVVKSESDSNRDRDKKSM